MLIKNFAVLFSGNGTNLQVLLEKLHNKEFNINNKNVKLVCKLCICNKNDAYGIIRAKKFGLDTVIVNHKDFLSREEFDKKLVEIIDKNDIDLTVLAGFMRILTPVFTNNVKAINLHPSILPLFKGAHAIKESFESDMMIGGASVHFVSDELDSGKIILQKTFERKDEMSFEEWEENIHDIEHDILPKAAIKILTKDLNV